MFERLRTSRGKSRVVKRWKVASPAPGSWTKLTAPSGNKAAAAVPSKAAKASRPFSPATCCTNTPGVTLIDLGTVDPDPLLLTSIIEIGNRDELGFNTSESIDIAVSSNIVDAGTQGGALVKQGLGTLELSGVHLYSGGTRVEWTAEPGAQYEIFRAEVNPLVGEYEKINAEPVTGGGFTDPGASPGTAYAYQVVAVGAQDRRSLPAFTQPLRPAGLPGRRF